MKKPSFSSLVFCPSVNPHSPGHGRDDDFSKRYCDFKNRLVRFLESSPRKDEERLNELAPSERFLVFLGHEFLRRLWDEQDTASVTLYNQVLTTALHHLGPFRSLKKTQKRDKCDMSHRTNTDQGKSLVLVLIDNDGKQTYHKSAPFVPSSYFVKNQENATRYPNTDEGLQATKRARERTACFLHIIFSDLPPSHEFVECPTCRKKPGTPVLCPACLRRRLKCEHMF